ncbi:MAG: PEGA domain-containing protein [Archangium sp.]|nr:PEGA domain-containing protein [Archangium sp.]
MRCVSLLLVASTFVMAEERAQLVITTTPAGAAITIDGQLVGLSPRTESLAAGVHTVTAELSGAMTSQTLSLAEGETRKLSIALDAVLPPRPAPVAGLITTAAGALSFGVGLLLQIPAREAGQQVHLLFERGGAWDASAQRLEQAGLSAQGWSFFFTGAGVAVIASGLLVTGLQLFGHRTDFPTLALLPTPQGGLLTWSTRW